MPTSPAIPLKGRKGDRHTCATDVRYKVNISGTSARLAQLDLTCLNGLARPEPNPHSRQSRQVRRYGIN